MTRDDMGPLADLLGRSGLFDRDDCPDRDSGPELAPETRIVVLNFPTEAQRTKAIDCIRESGRLRVRVPVD